MGVYKGKYGNMLNDMFLDALEKECYDFINKTLDIIEANGHEEYYEHETFNLHDSYGFGIFLNGKLMRRGWVDPKATAPREFPDGHVLWGGSEIETLFNGTDRTSNKGYVIMIAAAMPYALNLESGYKMKHKYKVITFMDDVAYHFGKTITNRPLVKKVEIRQYGEPTEW